MRQVSFSYPAGDANALAATQQILTTTGGYVALNGDYAFYRPGTQGQVPLYAVMPNGIQRTIGIFSTGQLQAVVFFASGLDTNGRVVTASFAGASGGSSTASDAFATFTAEFAQVNALFCTAAATSAFTAGVGATGSTRWVMMDPWKTPFNVTVAVITATGRAVTIQDTPNDPNLTSSPAVFSHATLVTVTANQESNYAFPVRFVRGIVTTGTSALLASSTTEILIQQAG